MNVVIAGGSGFLGQVLLHRLRTEGHEALVLTRSPTAAHDVAWDGRTLGDWCRRLEGADAIVNLTGRSINCVHNESNRRAILESRVDSVRVLLQAVQGCTKPPAVIVQASAAAIYGPAYEPRTESSALGDTFLATVCQTWERELVEGLLPASIRRCVIRLGVVLGPNAGVLLPLRQLTRLYLGGAAGKGDQYMSWIHIDDVVTMMLRCIQDSSISGAYNATAPFPVTNCEFMAALRQVLGRPWSPPVPEVCIRLGARYAMKTDPVLALESMRSIPARWQAAGFRFSYPELPAALTDIMSRWVD